MSTALLGFLISGSAIVGLISLFTFEQQRGVRVGDSIRQSADMFVIRARTLLYYVQSKFRRDIMRRVFHFSLSTTLGFVLGILRLLEESVVALQRSNRTLERRVYDSERVLSKLDEIAAHKESVALTPAEKRKTKAKAIEGKH